MNKKSIEISLLKDTEIDEVNRLHNLLYRENRNKEEFLWEFYQAPAGKAIFVVAKDAETQKIIGTQCAIPIEVENCNGDFILTAKSEDTLVHPDYRGLNVFENMYQLLFEECRKAGIKYIWGFTSAKKPFLKLGFEIPFDHSQSLLTLKMLSAYQYLSRLNSKNNTLSLIKIFALCALSRLSSFKRHFILQYDERFQYSIYEKPDLKDNSELLNGALQSGFIIRQNLSFIRWRLTNNPYHKKIYSISFSLDSKIAANMIFNYHEGGVWYLTNELYSKEISNKQRVVLFNQALKLLLIKENKKVDLIRTWDFTHNDQGINEIAIRKRAGFIHLDKGISFVWKSLDDNNILLATDFILSRIASQGVI